MLNRVLIAVGLVVVAGAIVLFAAAYTVPESQQALVTEFGKPVGDTVSKAGLHWKTPFIQKVHYFDKRLLEYDGDKSEVLTEDRKLIEIDTFARWRIRDPLPFYQSVRDEDGARRKLNDIVDSATRDAISSHVLIEAVRDTNRSLLQDAELQAASGDLEALPERLQGDENAPAAAPESESLSGADGRHRIEFGRRAITREIFEGAARQVEGLGIELVDVRIKSLNYVEAVQEKVFERMISERQQIAEKYRAEGQKIFAEVQGRIEKERNRILSEAYREAETLKGEAEAEAARIYAAAFGRDPEFYDFLKSLQIYRERLGENMALVVGTDSEIFRYIKSAGPFESAE